MYAPKEDSLLLSEQLEKYFKSLKNKDTKKLKALDIGTGSGIQAETLIKLGFNKKNILTSDIDNECINFVKQKGFNAVKSNLFKSIKGKFDLIVFNPPYLPESKYDKKKDTTGGKKGDETILRFLKQAKKHLTKQGKIFLLLSSLTPQNRINSLIKSYYTKRKLAEKKLFFEKLEVWLLSS